jgi:hypothetical protein
MNRSNWIIIAVASVLLFSFMRRFLAGGDDTIEYRGEQFKMAKTYWSYEDYKDDPNNLDTNELPRIEAAVVSANIGTNFDTRGQFTRSVFGVKFPGYGLEQFGEKPQADGSFLSVFSIEIPQRNKDRYFVAKETGSRYVLVDDFVAGSVSNVIRQVKLEGTRLRYEDETGRTVRVHELSQ